MTDILNDGGELDIKDEVTVGWNVGSSANWTVGHGGWDD